MEPRGHTHAGTPRLGKGGPPNRGDCLEAHGTLQLLISGHQGPLIVYSTGLIQVTPMATRVLSPVMSSCQVPWDQGRCGLVYLTPPMYGV